MGFTYWVGAIVFGWETCLGYFEVGRNVRANQNFTSLRHPFLLLRGEKKKNPPSAGMRSGFPFLNWKIIVAVVEMLKKRKKKLSSIRCHTQFLKTQRCKRGRAVAESCFISHLQHLFLMLMRFGSCERQRSHINIKPFLIVFWSVWHSSGLTVLVFHTFSQQKKKKKVSQGDHRNAKQRIVLSCNRTIYRISTVWTDDDGYENQHPHVAFLIFISG